MENNKRTFNGSHRLLRQLQLLRQRRSVYLAMLAVLVAMLTGCGTSLSDQLVDDKVNVVTSFYPLYDFAKAIGGEHVNVINLVPAGVDAHDWSPKPRDMINMSHADLFIYNGLGFEGWVDQLLSSLDEESKLVVVKATSDIVPIMHDRQGEIKHGNDDEIKHGDHNEAEQDIHDGIKHDIHVNHDGTMHGSGFQYDPHVWLSPLQAMQMAAHIKEALIAVDADNRLDYEANYDVFHAELAELHEQYRDVINAAPKKQMVVSHEAYGYLARDYGLEQIGVLGLSTSAEPTVQTMKRMIDFIKDNEIEYILFEELASPKVAKILAVDAGVETAVFHTLEGLTDDQISAGENYISIMKRNLASLEKVLQ